MNIETLYPLVTEAIRRAEVLEDLHAPGARDAWRDVSLLEEQIARVLPHGDLEGEVARRGAISAAISGEAFQRAIDLADRFIAESNAGTPHSDKLRTLRAEAMAMRSSIGQRDAEVLRDEPARQLSNPLLTAALTSHREDKPGGTERGNRNLAEPTAPPPPRDDAEKWHLLKEYLLNIVVQELKHSGKVTVPDFGTFTVRKTLPREEFKQGTGVKREGKTVRFLASPALKKAV